MKTEWLCESCCGAANKTNLSRKEIGRCSTCGVESRVWRITPQPYGVDADRERLDWLERVINTEGAIVLHDGNADVGKHSGLGLRPGFVNRTLREAIDAARTSESNHAMNTIRRGVRIGTRTGDL